MIGRGSRISAVMFLLGCGTEDVASLPSTANRQADVSTRDAVKHEELQRKKVETLARYESLGGRYNTSRESLDLFGSQVTDQDLALIEFLPEVERINLGKTKITDAGLVSLAGLAGLRQLNLANTQVTDEGLSNLKEVPRLRSLDIRGTLITDVGLEHVKRLKSINHVCLSKDLITDAAVDRFAEERPECNIFRP